MALVPACCECLTEAGVMHEAGYVYSIPRTQYHFTHRYIAHVYFIIWEVLLANAMDF